MNASNTVRIDAVLSMAESRGLLKVLSRPRVVTQNNIQAFVKQGVRVPIVTQAQLGGPPTVTYVDAFLRLTVTPQITSENTIFLNVDVENTTPNFGQEVQGNPELITQQATTQVLVTDGGTVVIGGVIQTQNSINISQVPLLGNIPVPGQPVQAHAGQDLQPGVDFLHHAANHSDITFVRQSTARVRRLKPPVLKNLSGRRFCFLDLIHLYCRVRWDGVGLTSNNCFRFSCSDSVTEIAFLCETFAVRGSMPSALPP